VFKRVLGRRRFWQKKIQQQFLTTPRGEVGPQGWTLSLKPGLHEQ
jgi:hypothetical protein